MMLMTPTFRWFVGAQTNPGYAVDRSANRDLRRIITIEDEGSVGETHQACPEMKAEA
jgi:hypothetical protein